MKQAFADVGATGDVSPYFQTLRAICDEVLELHENLGADSLLAAWFVVYDDACNAVYQQGKQRGLSQEQLFKVISKLAEFGCTPPSFDPASLIDTLSYRIGNIGLYGVMKEFSERYLEQGQAHTKKATASNSMDEHGFYLHRAGLWNMAAHRVLEGLLKGPVSSLPIERDVCVGANKKTEEEVVRIAHALLFAFEDRLGEQEERFAHDLKRVRKESGETGVDNQLYLWIDIQYFYPRPYKERLISRSLRV